MSDYFELFGLEARLALDARDLQRRFYALSRKLHPDRNPGADALDAGARLNDAYRTLRNPVARAEYLLKLRGLDTAAAKQPPPELLEEVFEYNLALEEADEEQVTAARRHFTALRDEIDRTLEAQFCEHDAGGQSLDEIRALLSRRKYISNLIERGMAAKERESEFQPPRDTDAHR